MSGDEVVGVVKESIGRRKARCSIKICLVSWEWGQRMRSGHSKVYYRAGDGTGGIEYGEEMGEWRSEANHLLSWPVCFSDRLG